MLPKYRTEDTIAAIATPPGRGAIGIIKISGEQAKSILQKIFQPAKPHTDFISHRLYYGFIVDPEKAERIDEVLAVYMKAPHTYTREDVVEIHGHSGYYNLRKILELVLRHGARLAEPGEFTLRAFLNGRIDLTQAEAIEELISAKTEASLKLALQSLTGRFTKRIGELKEELLEVFAHVESAIDFPEEDLEILSPEELKERLKERILDPIERLIKAQDEGKIYREGLNLVIAGKPNVGKSSLLNALLKEDRAIVSSMPGTTRDFLEETATIAGLPVKLVDTAGLRKTDDPVEEIGVKKAWEKIKSADLVLFLVSAEEPPSEEIQSLYQELKSYPHLLVINKIDLKPNFVDAWEVFAKGNQVEALKISAIEGFGLEDLSKGIYEKVITSSQAEIPEVSPNLRQKVALIKAKEGIELALAELEKKEPLPELIAIGLRSALSSLFEITGEVTTEDLLTTIFSRFCIGK